MRAPFSWFGGKMFMIKNMLPLIPEHKVYVEGFGGSGALLFAKTPSTVEVYNDLNSGLVHFFRTLRDPELAPKLQEKLFLTPYSREEFFYSREEWMHQEDPVEKARMWFVVARNCFASAFETGGWRRSTGAHSRGMGTVVSAYWSSIEMFPELHNRLLGVQIENVSYDRLIPGYDSRDTFFYFDPPYVLDTRTGGKQYEKEMTNDDHIAFVSNMLTIRGKVMISGYDHEVYAPLVDAGWARIDVDVATTAGLSKAKALEQRLTGERLYGARERRTECLWLNYAIH
jgi:DNA adenine methylase